MRAFVILSLLATVYGQSNSGYNYNAASSDHYASSSPLAQQGYRQEPLITKQFYIHSAPEEHAAHHTKHFVLGRPQKNYRVVFIKAPASAPSRVHLSAEYAPVEEKTHIYVLTKKQPELEVNDLASPPPTQPSKPEVYFVKYKTPEEAHHAQQKIQAQYDSLGGSTQVIDEGTAPVSSVIGALGNSDELAPSSSNLDDVKTGGVSNNYLPPKSSYIPPAKF